MRLNVEMTLSAETAQRLVETAERLVEKDRSDDALLAAAVLMRIARNYQIAAEKLRADGPTRDETGPKTRRSSPA